MIVPLDSQRLSPDRINSPSKIDDFSQVRSHVGERGNLCMRSMRDGFYSDCQLGPGHGPRNGQSGDLQSSRDVWVVIKSPGNFPLDKYQHIPDVSSVSNSFTRSHVRTFKEVARPPRTSTFLFTLPVVRKIYFYFCINNYPPIFYKMNYRTIDCF